MRFLLWPADALSLEFRRGQTFFSLLSDLYYGHCPKDRAEHIITSQQCLSFLLFVANWMDRWKLLIFQEEYIQKGVPWGWGLAVYGFRPDTCYHGGPWSIPGLGTEIPHPASLHLRQNQKQEQRTAKNEYMKDIHLSKHRVNFLDLINLVLRFKFWTLD